VISPLISKEAIYELVLLPVTKYSGKSDNVIIEVIESDVNLCI
jgi:hypothetical protein